MHVRQSLSVLSSQVALYKIKKIKKNQEESQSGQIATALSKVPSSHMHLPLGYKVLVAGQLVHFVSSFDSEHYALILNE